MTKRMTKQWRRRIGVWLVLTALLCTAAAPRVSADFSKSEALTVYQGLTQETFTAKSYAAVEFESGEMTLSGGGRTHVIPGNLVKLMTLLLTFEAIDSGAIRLDSVFSVSAHAQKISEGRVRVFLDAGKHEAISVEQAITAIAINGAYDAACALAEYVGGSESAFVEQMNARCAEWGLTDTHFTDATGIDTAQYTCAEDLVVIAWKLFHDHPASFAYMNLTYGMFQHTSTGEPDTEMVSSNPLNRKKFYENSTGSMIGYSAQDGYSLAAVANRGDKRAVGVVLGVPEENNRAAEIRWLLEHSISDYEFRDLCAAGTFVRKVDIRDGKEKQIKTCTKNDYAILLRVGDISKVKTAVEITQNLRAPIQEGAEVGYVVYLLDGEEIGRTELVTAEKMERAGWFVRLIRRILAWFGL